MQNFVKCPCCSGHEAIGAETVEALKQMIDNLIDRKNDIPFVHPEVEAELINIRNQIANTQEREERQPEYTPPICPTPAKRKYSNRQHAAPFAVKWHQHAYECECGFWHLSKQTPAEHKAKINSPAATADEFIDPLLL